MNRIFQFLAIAVLFTACTNRTLYTIEPDSLSFGSPRTIFVGTNRGFDMPGAFTEVRSNMSFGTYTVSVPPNRKLGQVPVQFGNTVDPEKNFVVAARELHDDSTAFRKSLSRHIAKNSSPDKSTIVFVHGFNNTFNDGLYRFAQMAEDLGVDDTIAHFSWPSAGNPLNYAYDRDSILFARDDLEAFLGEIKKAGAKNILLLGHSVGSLLIVETLRQMAHKNSPVKVGSVVLMSPDIDVDVFRRQVEVIPELPQPFAIFVSDRDHALMLSARLTGQSRRVGNLSDASAYADLPITLIDITNFTDGGIGNHFTAGSSPSLLRLLTRSQELNASFASDKSGRAGLLPGTVVTFQNATQIILTPGSAVTF